MRKITYLFLLLLFLTGCSSNKSECKAYLFTYFTGNGEGQEAIHFALSNDGYNYYTVNDNQPVIDSKAISSTGGVRDPHILRSHDGNMFYMVVTDMQVAENGWGANHGLVLLKSSDLINWESSAINITEKFAEYKDVNRVWAPQTIYDEKAGKYMVYWSMRFGEGSDIFYYSYANKDFTDLETVPQVLYKDPNGGATIDADIVEKDGEFHMFFKTESDGQGIKKAVSSTLTGGYVVKDDKILNQTTDAVEGSSVFKLINSDTYMLIYDMYKRGRYQFTESTDLSNFTVVDNTVSMDFHPRHGSVIAITEKEAQRVVDKWVSKNALTVKSSNSPEVKKINISPDKNGEKVMIPVVNGTNLANFDPQLVSFPGCKITPEGVQDFTKGGVNYTISTQSGVSKSLLVEAQVMNNPVLTGFYADPDVLYSKKTNKYYIYPTSDGFTGWSGYYFKTFSSDNLVDWKDEGVIIDLKKDLTWANRNAWAPCIIEHEVNGEYKFYYYFTAAQKIGVAVADNPTGPFTDSGKALVDSKPEGVNEGQEIDPDVFRDPVSGKSYLYWGNGYAAVAELNDDMVSLKPNTTRVITPDNTFREGIYVFYRKGMYYFVWSEDDTRSENYRVRYGTSDSPLGPIKVPDNNLILKKDEYLGIYGTGHNSILEIPDKDEWYIVYHRFNYPKGITMGDAAGYNREVCIDRMYFNEDGSIRPVIPTLTGIEPLK